MDLFSDFCNICYKTDDRCLKDTSEENVNNLNDTLITFIGHADIINDNMINLCQSCCEELTRSNKFREKCFTNLIQLRQSVIDMKSKLELEHGTWAVQNTLKMFVHQEVLRRNTFEQRNCLVLIPTEHEKSSGDLSENNSFFNRQIVNVQSKRNECAFVGDCSDKSVKKSESQVAFTTVDSAFVKCEKEPHEDFDYTEEFDAINETGQIVSEDFESRVHVNPYVEVPAVNNSEGIINSGIEYITEPLYVKQETSVSEDFESEAIGNELGDGQNVPIEFVNACTIVKTEEGGAKSIAIEENAQEDMNLPSTGCNYELTSRTINSQPSRPHVQEHRNGRCATTLQSGAHKHMCAVCNKTFKTRTMLSRHERIHSGDRPYKCSMCDRTFAQPANLTVHESTHSGEKPYKCTFCDKAFTQSYYLTAHLRRHTGEKPYKCAVCNKAFTDSSSLTVHKRIHNDNKPHMCTVCNKEFTQSFDLTIHERIHSGDKQYECTVCNKTFVDSLTLNIHKREHNTDRPYKCTYCKMVFTELSTLTDHESTHRGERAYKCAICNKAFMYLSRLVTHERSHSGERPYKCSVCNKGFITSSHLTRHKRTHSGDRPYRCTVCDMAFTASSHLTRHERAHSGDRPYKCTICEKAFTELFNLTVHERIHSGHRPYKCSYCNKAFKDSSSFIKHKRIHTADMPYKCTDCSTTCSHSSNITAQTCAHNVQSNDE